MPGVLELLNVLSAARHSPYYYMLVKSKDHVSKENVLGPVYKIKCEECEATYIGETERSLKSRFNVHQRPSSTISEVAKYIHMEQPEHTVELDNY